MTKLTFVTLDAPDNIYSWSGTPYHMRKSLNKVYPDMDSLGPLQQKGYYALRLKQKILKLMGQTYVPESNTNCLKHFSKQVKNHIKKHSSELIFTPSTYPISYLDIDLPIVFWTDATFAGMIDFYPSKPLCKESLIEANKATQLALSRSALCIYSSDWAAKSAIDNYEVPSSKILVVPFGANIESSLDLATIREIIQQRSTTMCKLLFIGVDWVRKGGHIALEVAKQLNESGLKTELTVLGCKPQINGPLPSYVNVVGYVDKLAPQGRETFSSILKESHFFIMPSIAECYGIVFCEANAFGVPAIGTNVGGIPTIIHSNINGMLFDLTQPISDYCDFITNHFRSPETYRALALSSFNEYQKRLNWDASVQSVQSLISKLL